MPVNRIVLLILMGVYGFLGIYFKPWAYMVEKSGVEERLFSLTALITLIGLILCCFFMQFKKRAGRKCFFFFNGIYLLLGCFSVYFYWTVWFFKTPTLLDRIRDSLIPFLLGVAMPIGLFYYFLRSKRRTSHSKISASKGLPSGKGSS